MTDELERRRIEKSLLEQLSAGLTDVDVETVPTSELVGWVVLMMGPEYGPDKTPGKWEWMRRCEAELNRRVPV